MGYRRLKQGVEAVTEFQKLPDHRGCVANLPLSALAHLRLGRAYVWQGGAAKSLDSCAASGTPIYFSRTEASNRKIKPLVR
jgi:hypothetical protein